ncbi:hypothetical protein WMY93_010621 [Mugilogobius chulae]|uniref:Leucine zipper tumor suppressor 2 homolog n=1 Tax=Mugilogobius chulae TaxID=88201 RepID=A0AAW0PGS9_9GOBI
MALVQALPMSAESHTPGLSGGARRHHHSNPSPPPNPPPSALEPMGSGSSLAPPELSHTRIIGRKRTYTYLNEEYVDDWNETLVNPVCPVGETDDTKEGINGNMGGPPPKLIPVSGKLEKNMEKTILRPTAFKPVIPKSRTSMQYLSPRHCANIQDNTANMNLLSPTHRDVSPPSPDKRSSYSGRNAASSSHLPPYGVVGYGMASSEVSSGHLEKNIQPGSAHGHSNSDSGRSSSSKSTGSGSLTGRGQPLSDSGSNGRSPGPVEGYEGIVRDLEDKLRERDMELQLLRDNLDENEAAICQVYEEKQKRFELEIEELRQSCATKMQSTSQKAQRAQQVLQLQVYQLQQEKRKLQEDFGQLLKEREHLEERCTSYEHEKIQLGPRLEETKWEVCQKSGEISLLKQQLKEVQGELAQRVGEIVSLRGQLRETRGELTNTQVLLQEAHGMNRTRTLELEVCENELQRRKSEAELLRDKVGRLESEIVQLRDTLANQGPGNRQCQVFQEAEEHLLAFESDEAKAQRQTHTEAMQNIKSQMDRMKSELTFERQRAEEQLVNFEEERKVWHEEKDKVIRYQKQLQQNYVQMYRRNRELEQHLQELSQELDSRDDDDGSGNEINFDEIAATEI